MYNPRTMRKNLKVLLIVLAFFLTVPFIYAANASEMRVDGHGSDVVIQAPSGPFTADPYSAEYILVGNEEIGGEFYIPSSMDGTFGGKSSIDSYGNVDGLVIADFDNDGDLDFILGNGDLDEAYLYRNDGVGAFTPTIVATGITPESDFCSQFRAGDIDGDGWIDWVGGDGGGAKWWFRNNRDGTFAPYALDVSWHDDLLPTLDVGDFDNDGNDDIVMMDAYGNTSCRVRLYRGDGAGGFIHSQVIDYLADSGTHSAFGLAAGDFNGDGDLDLVLGGGLSVNAGIYHLYLGDGAGGFMLQGQAFDVGGTQGMADAFDIDHDGKIDVVACNWVGNQCRLVKGNGDGTFQTPVTIDTFELPMGGIAAPYLRKMPVGGFILPIGTDVFAPSVLAFAVVFALVFLVSARKAVSARHENRKSILGHSQIRPDL